MFKSKKHLFSYLLIFSVSYLFFAEDYPKGYKGISLGMSFDDTKIALLKDSDFGYHGDRDVSLIPGTNKTLIETDANYGHGSNYLERCWFQFTNDYLYIITININQEKERQEYLKVTEFERENIRKMQDTEFKRYREQQEEIRRAEKQQEMLRRKGAGIK